MGENSDLISDFLASHPLPVHKIVVDDYVVGRGRSPLSSLLGDEVEIVGLVCDPAGYQSSLVRVSDILGVVAQVELRSCVLIYTYVGKIGLKRSI